MRIGCDNSTPSVWRIQLAPDASNAAADSTNVVLSASGLSELSALLERAEADERCRLIVLQGTPGVFCRGMNLEWAAKSIAAAPQVPFPPGRISDDGARLYAGCLQRLRGCSKFVVALIDGEVIAGGVGLALSADEVIATTRAEFATPEVILGIVPAMVLPLLLERMPPQKARRFALGGQRVDAATARAMGLIDRLVDTPRELESALSQLARQMLRAKPEAVARIKRLSDQFAMLSWRQAVSAGAECTAEILAQPEGVSGIDAFLRGEQPPWFERYRRGG